MTSRLEEVLLAREERAALQAELALRWSCPVLSLTLVTPGPVKDDPLRRHLMDLAEAAAEAALAKAGYRVLAGLRRDGAAGPEALRAVEAPPLGLKGLALALEDSLPWGRLLDADVLTLSPGQGPEPRLPEPLSRAALGLAPRACLVCQRDARSCMAEGRHSAEDVALALGRLLALVP